MSELKSACIIGQSGGPTAVINVGVASGMQTALNTDCITHILGSFHGIKGMLNVRTL